MAFHSVIHNVLLGDQHSGRKPGLSAMFAVAIALFFAAAAIAAVLVIAQSFAGSVERFDALFTAYRAAEQGRVARGQMRAAVTYVPARAPDCSPRNVIAMPVRGNVTVSRPDWRAAA
jgi:hypothetical protein